MGVVGSVHGDMKAYWVAYKRSFRDPIGYIDGVIFHRTTNSGTNVPTTLNSLLEQL